MSRISAWIETSRRYPLYAGLSAALTACALSVALGLLGSVEVSRQLGAGFASVLATCAEVQAGGPVEICAALRTLDAHIQQRVLVALLMQGLCVLLLVGGVWMIIGRAREVLVERPTSALQLSGLEPGPAGRDEMDRLIEALKALAARQVSLSAEERLGQQVVNEHIRRSGQGLQVLHQVARTLSERDVSEIGLVNSLLLLEPCLGSRTVGIRFDAATQSALGIAAAVTTHGEPVLFRSLSPDHGQRDGSARMVPHPDAVSGQSLVVPLSRGHAAIGTLVAEFSGSARIDDLQVMLVESFARMLALAISSVSRNQEERRLALMEERSAIAAELHDSLAQSLAFMKIQVARLQAGLTQEPPPADVRQSVVELRTALSSAYRGVRELIAAFRARMGPGGLVVAVQEAVEEFSQRSNLEIRFDNRLGRCHLEVNEEFHVLQVVREALSNAVRHARATQICIVAAYGPDHRLVVTVDDDGTGPATASDDGAHHGMSIMKERAGTLGGDLDIGRGPAGGTQVRLSFPPQRLPAPASAATW